MAAAAVAPSSGSMTQQASTSRTGSSRRCPVTTRPSSKRRQNTVRSWQPKPASRVASCTLGARSRRCARCRRPPLRRRAGQRARLSRFLLRRRSGRLIATSVGGRRRRFRRVLHGRMSRPRVHRQLPGSALDPLVLPDHPARPRGVLVSRLVGLADCSRDSTAGRYLVPGSLRPLADS